MVLIFHLTGGFSMVLSHRSVLACDVSPFSPPISSRADRSHLRRIQSRPLTNTSIFLVYGFRMPLYSCVHKTHASFGDDTKKYGERL